MAMLRSMLESTGIVESATKASSEAIIPRVLSESAVKSDETVVRHHVANGGCADDFTKAMYECHPDYAVEHDDGAAGGGKAGCVKATAALRKCFAGNPAMFKHQYLRRMDKGLDQDLKPSPETVKEEEKTGFRWWTGMKREAYKLW